MRTAVRKAARMPDLERYRKHRTNEARVASSDRRVDVDFEFDVSVPICRDYFSNREKVDLDP